MPKKPFDESELVSSGTYPPLFNGAPGAPRYPRPVSPRENALMYFRGEKPYWMPQWSMGASDVMGFRPRMHPDNVATHLIIDAEEPYVYESNVMRGWFDLEWVYVPQVGGATVRPGNPKVPDMSEWESYVSIPSLDDFDWEASSKINRDFLNSTDQIREVCCLSGLWERLISLCDVEGAAVALIDEDQKEGVHRFFTALCDMYDDLIARYAKYFDLEFLLMHDDWGTQNAPFFSLETCREMIAPYLKRVVDACHKNELYFELHCCGNDEALVPAMIEAGVDVWCGQQLNDYDKLSQMYPDTCLSFGVYPPEIPEDMADDEIRRIAEEFVDHFKDRRVVVNTKCDPRLLREIYIASRKYLAQF